MNERVFNAACFFLLQQEQMCIVYRARKNVAVFVILWRISFYCNLETYACKLLVYLRVIFSLLLFLLRLLRFLQFNDVRVQVNFFLLMCNVQLC